MLDKSKRFNYRTASDNEMVEHILSASPQAVQAAILYYDKQGEHDVVTKIRRMRNKAKLRRLELKINETDNNEDYCGSANLNGEED